jgi:DNA-binding MarR family transcriptional regulator
MNTKTADGLGTQLRRLLELLDGDVEAIYRRDHSYYLPRFTPVMKALTEKEPQTIKAIAERSSISHSAASQTVTRMTELGLVELQVDSDRRARLVCLTEEGRELLPWLQQRWQATTRAARSLDRELSYPLSELLSEAVALLERKPFADRIDRAAGTSK